jgi:hypothetical protein
MAERRQPALDERLQAEADAAEERRVAAERPEPVYCEGCGGELDPSVRPLACGDWHASCAEAEFDPGDDGLDHYDPADDLCRKIASPSRSPEREALGYE